LASAHQRSTFVVEQSGIAPQRHTRREAGPQSHGTPRESRAAGLPNGAQSTMSFWDGQRSPLPPGWRRRRSGLLVPTTVEIEGPSARRSDARLSVRRLLQCAARLAAGLYLAAALAEITGVQLKDVVSGSPLSSQTLVRLVTPPAPSIQTPPPGAPSPLAHQRALNPRSGQRKPRRHNASQQIDHRS
jgi:hypothetical protein